MKPDPVTADLPERHPETAIGRIDGDSYLPHADVLRHVFLTGDLQAPSPHPYFHEERVELIYCSYQAGDHGSFHWHRAITEYQIVISGAFGVREASSGRLTWFRPGDVSCIPAGVCIERRIEEPTVTVAIKVPSVPGDKVHCAGCRRTCRWRREAFEGSSSQ